MAAARMRQGMHTARTRRHARYGDAISFVLTAAFILSLGLVGLVSILFLLGNVTAASIGVLTLLVVLLVLGVVFVMAGNSTRR